MIGIGLVAMRNTIRISKLKYKLCPKINGTILSGIVGFVAIRI